MRSTSSEAAAATSVDHSLLDQCALALEEFELYLSGDHLTTDSVGGSLRRLSQLHDGARSLGLDHLSRVAITLETAVRQLHRQGTIRLPYRPLECGTKLLRGLLESERMRRRGTLFPVGWEAFCAASVDAVCSCLNRQQCGEPFACRDGLAVLLVDDEQIVREYLADILDRGSHRVLALENGSVAPAVLQTGLFDLMFTDLSLPGMSGMELLQEARAVSPDTEVVIITAYATVENAVEAVRFGAYDYLTKPFSSGHVITSVVQRVRKHRLLRIENRRLQMRQRRQNEELRRYAESLEDALKAVEEKGRALIHADRMATLGSLSAGVAHEINNPTTFVRGNLETLEKFWGLIEPILQEWKAGHDDRRIEFILHETPQLVRDMISGTDRIGKIVSALRSFAHQPVSARREVVDIHVCLRDALDLIRNRCKNDLTITKEWGDLPEIEADPQQLTQVFVNLLTNALDATEGAARREVLLRTRLIGDQVVVEVEDNGHGVPAEIRSRIFDPFFTTKGIGRGTGLGLSILSGIVRDHGGRVELEEGASGGALFRVLLPLQGASPVVERPTVLLVDDDSDSLHVLASALRAQGQYHVVTAESGVEAVDRVRERAPDVVVLDLIMPEMDGFELVSTLRGSLCPSPEIVVQTGLDLVAVESRLAEMGVQEVFFKPCRMKDLLQAIERSAERSARRRQPQAAGIHPEERVESDR